MQNLQDLWQIGHNSEEVVESGEKDMSDHKKRSPSKGGRWFRCPGSINKCAGIPDKSSKSADDGTHTHYLFERFNREVDFIPQIGDRYTSSVGEFYLEADRLERLNFALDYVEDRKKEIGICNLYPEEFLPSSAVFGRDDLGGTVDLQIVGGEVLEVVDLKDGMSPVSANDNIQLIIYGLLSLSKHMLAGQMNLKTIRLTIIQPKLRFTGAEGISYTEYSLKELLEWLPKIIDAAKATDDPNAPTVPGETQCKWCPARGSCMALLEKAMGENGISLDPIDMTDEVVKVDPTVLSNDRLRSLIQAIPLIETLIEAAEEEALRRFENGDKIEGLKVIRGRGSRTWAYPGDEIAEKLRKMGIPKDLVYKTTVLTPLQTESLKWKKKKGGEEVEVRLSPRQVATLQKEYIKKNEGKLKVVSEEADGKAIDLTPLEALDPVLPEWLAIPDWMK
jgi:hypothetical protein